MKARLFQQVGGESAGAGSSPGSARPYLLALLALLLAGASANAEPTPVFPHPERIRYDSHCLQIEGKDTFIYSGAFHYFRCPKELWKDRFQKIKDAGFNCVETYAPWNWHEREMPASPEDFSRVADLQLLDDWLSMAEQFGLYVIVRPGPYICAEWAGGGFPGWLVTFKKPADWPADKPWLRSDEAAFVAWSRHWYRAVCPVVAKHQITRKAPGQPGVILVQIENEYDFAKVPSEAKKRYLEALADAARAGGIEVPLFTCVTRESQGVAQGPLRGVFDMMNYYPRWEIKKAMLARTAAQRTRQPEAPATSAEMQSSMPPAHTQNITLHALQLGYSLINYYLVFGGTNFDDWASRSWVTTYDNSFPVRENGGVDEKFQRVAGIARLLREHGAQLMRSEPVELEATLSDPAVEMAARAGRDGSRFIFIRTEEQKSPHTGTARWREKDGASFAVDYALEPFGSKVLYLAPGVTDPKKGEWLPKLGPLPARPAPGELPRAISLGETERFADPLPEKWTPLPPGDLLEKHGVSDFHPVYYRVAPPAGQPFTVERAVGDTTADGVIALAGGRLLPEKSRDGAGVTFDMPTGAKEVFLLLENRGRSHVLGPAVESHWNLGITQVLSGGQPVPLAFATTERERGLAYSDPLVAAPQAAAVPVGKEAPAAPGALLVWYRASFELPVPGAGAWVPWNLHLQTLGDGFIYLNGRCLGRIWQSGTPSGASLRVHPQHDFYLPECWLNFGPGKKNVLTLSLVPVDGNARVEAADIQPVSEAAEKRPATYVETN